MSSSEARIVINNLDMVYRLAVTFIYCVLHEKWGSRKVVIVRYILYPSMFGDIIVVGKFYRV